jgi:hypothetical protein
MPNLWQSYQEARLPSGIPTQEKKRPGAPPDGDDRREVGKVNITIDNRNERDY